MPFLIRYIDLECLALLQFDARNALVVFFFSSGIDCPPSISISTIFCPAIVSDLSKEM
jgi:hypothetical protein